MSLLRGSQPVRHVADLGELFLSVQNRLDGDTPLHLACKLKHPDARFHIVSSLLDAGADPRCTPSSFNLADGWWTDLNLTKDTKQSSYIAH